MKEKSWLCLWGVLFTLATFVSGLFSWFTPLPLFYIGRRYSIRLALLGCFAVLVLLGVLYALILGLLGGKTENHLLQWFMWLPGMLYYKQFGAWMVWKALAVYFSFNISFSLLLAWRSKKEKNITRLASQVALGSLLSSVFVLFLCIGPSSLASFVALIEKYTVSVLDQVIAFNRSTGMSGEEMLYIQQNKEWIAKGFVSILPALAVSALFFLVWINLYLARRLFNVFALFEKVQDLLLFRISFVWVWGVITSLAVFLLNLYLLKLEIISMVLFNFLIVFATIYFFQGLAILAYFLVTRQFASWIRLFCYFLLIIFIQPLGILLMGLGFFDSWYDFRKINVQKV